jgi:hypothetical protein
VELLKKLPVEMGRRVLFVLPELHKGLMLSSRNIRSVKAIQVAYLNPEDVMNARAVVFVGDAIQRAEAIFTKKSQRMKMEETAPEKPKKPAQPKKVKKASSAKIAKSAKKKADSSAK